MQSGFNAAASEYGAKLVSEEDLAATHTFVPYARSLNKLAHGIAVQPTA